MKNIAEQEPVGTNVTSPQQTRRLPLFALLTANVISFVGDVLMALAVPWFVLQTTGSVAKTGITAFFTFLPNVISAFFSGVLVDRLGYKRASIVSDIMSGVSVALIPLLYYTVGLAFWQLLILVFLGGLFETPGATARSSLVPDLAQLARMPLERANAASDGMRRVSSFIGAPLAAILIVLIGSSNLLWFDAASFIISALLIGLAVPRTPPVTQAEKEGPHRYLADMLEGLRFTYRNQFLLAILITVMITNLLDTASYSVLMPAYTKHFFGSIVPLGIMSATFGGAAFLGTLIFGAIGHRLPRRMTLAVCFIIIGMRYWLLLFVPPLPVIIAAYIVMGLSVGPINPLLMTAEQEIIPTEMRARVFGVGTAGSLAGIPLGALMCGYLVEWIGILPCLAVIAVCYLLATGSLLVNPALKGMERRATP